MPEEYDHSDVVALLTLQYHREDSGPMRAEIQQAIAWVRNAAWTIEDYEQREFGDD